MAEVSPRHTSTIHRFLNAPAAAGIVLMASAVLALVIANSPLSTIYDAVLHHEFGGLSVLHWINDGLMALFFLLVGLEIKREVLEGQLSTWSRRVLPGVGALGGMLVPALIYLAFNGGTDGHPRGWAIPSATDIAFALGVLALLGPRVPSSLRVFLTALAIIDDLGAILIIAFFYAGDLNLYALGGAALVLAGLAGLNRANVNNLAPYLLLGALLWVLVLLSGLHATLAGVCLALTIPLTVDGKGPVASPLHRLEHGLQPWVNFLVVPLFGLANAGVAFAGMSLASLTGSIPLGVAFGLFFGKQLGVFAFAWVTIAAGWAQLPDRASWRQFYGVGLLCGIGFTMSLFIGLLAFPGSVEQQDETKIGVLLGSVLAAAAGAILLSTGCSKAASEPLLTTD
ncbi:MAG: Na+/H+ antiporter NhaA [Rhizobium sp.]